MSELRITSASIDFAVLRLWQPDSALFDALSRWLGARWPVAPNTIAGRGPRVLWLAPAEWAIVEAPKTFRDLERELGEICVQHLHHLSDLTGSRTAFDITGSQAAELLAKGCSLDFGSPALALGRCAQSLLAQVPMLVHRSGTAAAGDGESFRVIIDTSLASWVRSWLDDAAGEFGGTRGGAG